MIESRVGFGFDSHRFVAGRPLVLGGVNIPFEFGLAGHSDADALTHAIIDALLGATGLGNIGVRFPDSDETYRNADSAVLLASVWRELSQAGWRVVNVDSVIVTDQPRLGPHLAAMRERLAGLLETEPERVNVKPKTAEGTGLTGPIGRPGQAGQDPDGRQEAGLAAMAVVLLSR